MLRTPNTISYFFSLNDVADIWLVLIWWFMCIQRDPLLLMWVESIIHCQLDLWENLGTHFRVNSILLHIYHSISCNCLAHVRSLFITRHHSSSPSSSQQTPSCYTFIDLVNPKKIIQNIIRHVFVFKRCSTKIQF